MRRKPVQFIEDENGCHVCTSHARNQDGYPRIWKNGHHHNMHRVLYQERKGVVLADDVVVRHTCDNRGCIRQEHLIEGSSADNTQDMMDRQRARPRYGEAHVQAKLTTRQVRAIKAAKGSQYKIARRYGVNQSTISRIKGGQRRRREMSLCA